MLLKSIIIFGFYITFCQPVYSCTLTLAVSESYPPYHIKKADGDWGGVSVDIVRALVNKSGCTLSVINVPWIRAIQLLKVGQIDILTNYTFTNIRNDFSLFLGPHHIEKVSFITNKHLNLDVIDVYSIAKFNGAIGITRGNSFGEEFDRYIIHNKDVIPKIVEIPNNEIRYLMLQKEHILGMFDDELSARYILSAQHPKSNKFELRFSLNKTPVYLGVSPVSVDLALRQKLNDVWLEMLNQNEISNIYEKYGLAIDTNELLDFPMMLLDLKQ